MISASSFGGGLTPGILPGNKFVLGSTANNAGDLEEIRSAVRFIYNANTDRLLYDSDGTGANSPIAIANFSNDIVLSNGNIEIIA